MLGGFQFVRPTPFQRVKSMTLSANVADSASDYGGICDKNNHKRNVSNYSSNNKWTPSLKAKIY